MGYLMKIVWATILLCWAHASFGVEATNVLFQRIVAHTPGTFVSSLSLNEISSNTIAYSTLNGNRCRVVISSSFVRDNPVDAVAFVMAHEEAHCALRHRTTSDQQVTWQQEYEADLLGTAIANDSGLYNQDEVTHLLLSIGKDINHPSGIARIKALHNDEREYPQLVWENGRLLLK